MAFSSYDDLLKQVASLKSENCHLRRELHDNSSHLTKLENDASNMKDVLSHIQINFEEQEIGEGDCGQETGADVYNAQSSPHFLDSTLEYSEDDKNNGSDDCDVNKSYSECSKGYGDDDFDNNSLDIDEEERSKISAQINPDEEEEESDADTERIDKEVAEKHDSEQEKKKCEKEDPVLASHTSLYDDSFEDDAYQGLAAAVGLEEAETSMTESSGSQAVDVYGLFQKLDSERKQLVVELDRDELHRHWFYQQLKTITQKMEGLQDTEMYTVQTDVARCQLELEAHKVLGAMQEKLGSGEQSKQRQEARLDRIRSIETEIRSLQMPLKQLIRDTKDASTSTTLTRDVFLIRSDQEDGVGGFASERTLARNGQHATVATQTGEVTLVEGADGVAPGIPLSSHLMVMYHGAWPIDKALTGSSGAYCIPPVSQDLASVISFNSTNTNSSGSIGGPPGHSQPSSTAFPTGEQSQQFGTKVEMVYSLLSMLGTHDKDDMSRTLFAMSQSQDSCIAMRQSGCLPLLLQLLHGSEKDSGLLGKTRGSKATRARAAAALHNIVHCNHDDKRGRREARTLRLLEQIRAHCDQQRGESDDEDEEAVVSNYPEMDHHPGAAIAALMKLSFDEDYRHAICTLGGLHAIAELLEVDNRSDTPVNDYSTTIRRYSCMALTNLTFGDGKNKALLCSMLCAMEALTDQLRSTNEDLIQAAASVLRNLSWRADLASKKALREIGAVTTLMRAAMMAKKETTLKSILSALWNLSSHCSENKAEICAVDGALQFLVTLLTYKSTAKTLAIIENGGGILRNVSSQIAIREDYRQILRKHDCLKILLHHLRSPSLTIVSNACGTLWNLSARCEEDQNALREMGAVSMLRNLVHSRHKMISSGSSAALRNLLSSVPAGKSADSDKSIESPRPSLHVRKQRALVAELDNNLSETCENVESPRGSPTEVVHRSESEPRRFVYHLGGGGGDGGGHRKEEDSRRHMTRRQMMPRSGNENMNSQSVSSSGQVVRTGSQDSVGSTHSDISHDRTRAHSMLAKSSLLLHKRQGGSLERTEQKHVVHNRTPRPNNHQGMLADGKTSNVHNSSTGSTGGTIVNNIPAHVRQPHHASFHQQQRQQHQNNQSWQTVPNSRIVKYMHEVAMYAGVEPSGSFHGHSSLTQSAPAQSFHYPSSHHPQQSLIERLAKPTSTLTSGSGNLNNTIAVTSNGGGGGTDFTNHRSHSSAADDETDQPVNYSLKYQDGSNPDRSNKSAPGSNKHLTYNHLTSGGSGSNLRTGAMAEHVRTGHVNDRSYLVSNSCVHDKVAASITGNNTLLSSSVMTPHRPVPNLVHNRFHTPQGYQSAGAPHHPQFMTPQVPYASTSPFHPRGYIYPSGHATQNPNPNLPSNIAVASNSSYIPQGKMFNTNAKQCHAVQTAHQNGPHLHPIQQFSTYAETDLDVVVDQPTDFSLRYSEVSEENCSEDYQEQPINYSMHFRESGAREGQQLALYRDDSHCVECKYAEARRTNERIDIISNDDQIRTFCTEGTPYLSTATSLTDLTQAGKIDREEEALEDGRREENNDKMSSDMERCGSRVEMNAAAGSSVSQSADRHACSAAIGSVRGQAIMPPKASSQMPDQHRVQQNFHANSHEGALDQTRTYCEEGTPVCFSRVSSLSSLHCTQARESDVQISNTEKVELACIDEADTPEALIISVIENKEALCSSSKSASSLRRTNADQVIKGDKESKTVTFDENNQVEETPLMFSRCSSPESLSSFDTQSVHSSVISEYSRRASEVVSPSEIPDSPSESMPPSPRQTHSPTRRFKDFPAASNAGNPISRQSLSFDKTPSTIKPESFDNFAAFEEEDKPINFAMRNAEIPLLQIFSGFEDDQPIDFSFVHREEEQSHLTFSTFQKNVKQQNLNQNNQLASKQMTPQAKALITLDEHNMETESLSGKSEVPVVYAQEGTPPNFSETTSLSGITMASSSTRGGGPRQSSTMQYLAQEPDLPKLEEKEFGLEIVQKLEAPSASFVAKENTSAKVWSPVTEQLKQDDRDSSMSDVSEGEEDILAQCISSGMPTPVASARKMRRSSSDNTTKKKSGIPMKTSPDAQSKTASKLPLVNKPPPKKLPSSHKALLDSTKTDNSSVENEELLLSQMIESGMPKSKPGRKFIGGADHTGGDGNVGKQSSRDSNTSAFIPRTTSITVVAPFHDFIPTDTLRTYNVEDTPRNFSTATSLSDLTIDSEEPKSSSAGLVRSPKAAKGIDAKTDATHSPSKLRMPGNLGHKLSAKGPSNPRQSVPQPIPRSCAGSSHDEPEYITFSPLSNDTVHTYGVEGTPTSFSRNDSLSSIGGGKDSRGLGSGVSASPHKDQGFPDRDESDSSSSMPKERHVIGQSSEDSSVTGDRRDKPIKFTLEDTPVCFSRNSSLSSLNSIDKVEHPETSSPPVRGDLAGPTAKGVKSNIKASESCDSLSDELADCDPTPSEQALLDQCINSAMPKSRLPKGDDRARRHSRAKFLTRKEAPVSGNCDSASSGNGLIKSASLEMPVSITSGYHSSSEVDPGPQSFLSRGQGRSENLMTRSCSDTTKLDLSFQIPPASSRRSRYTNWQWERNHPREDEGGDINEVSHKDNNSSTGSISTDEAQRLMSDNVDLMSPEVRTNRMTGSGIDDDLFIDNETISLVSNDYASDTNSEISITWSVTSDRNSDLSSAAYAENQSQGTSSIGGSGPRIMKQGTAQRHVKKTADDCDEVAKAVRGRRKLLYPNRVSSGGAVAKGSGKGLTSSGSKGVAIQVGSRGAAHAGGGGGRDAAVEGLKKAPPKNASATQVSPRAVVSQDSSPKNGSPLQTDADQRSRSAGPSSPGKRGASSAVTEKVGLKAAVHGASPGNQVNLTKAASKLGGATRTHMPTELPVDTNISPGRSSPLVASTKSPTSSSPLSGIPKSTGLSSPLSSTTKSLGRSSPLSGTPKSSGRSSPLLGTSKSSGRSSPLLGTPKSSGRSSPLLGTSKSRLPTASPSTKNSSHSAASAKKSTRTTSNTSASEKMAGQNSPKVACEALANNKGTSGIPTRKSTTNSPVLNSADSNKYTQNSNTDPNKRSSSGAAGKKQSASKIATLKKRDDGMDRSLSPVSSTSSSSRLPVSIMKTSPKPTSLPPSGFKSKAATLPNSSLASSNSKPVGDRITKSLTYEKITSELLSRYIISDIAAVKTAAFDSNTKQRGGTYDSPESGVRRGEVFELCDDDEDDGCENDIKSDITGYSNVQPNSSYDPNESLENTVFEDSLSSHKECGRLIINSNSSSMDYFEHSDDKGVHIDTSTFRKKKQGPNILDLELPNADETCRSMCSFNDSIGSPQSNNSIAASHKEGVIDDNIISEMVFAEMLQLERNETKIDSKHKHGEEKAGGKTKSIVAQGLKKLFSGLHKDKEKDSKVKVLDKESNKSKHVEKEQKTKHSKSNGKEKKNGKDKKDNDFFWSSIRIEPSSSWTASEKLVSNQGTCTAPSTKQVGNTAEVAATSAAEVKTICVSVSAECDDRPSEVTADSCSGLVSDRHMTKTEMLLARRRKTNLSSSHSEGSRGDGEITAGCMVTTV